MPKGGRPELALPEWQVDWGQIRAREMECDIIVKEMTREERSAIVSASRLARLACATGLRPD